MTTRPGRAPDPLGTRNAEPGTLVVQTAFLGDVVLTLPLISRLAAQYGPVDVVTLPAAAPLLAAQPAVRRVIPYDKRGRDRGPAALLRLAGRLRAERFARAFLPHRSLRTALLARLAGIPERTGFAGGLAGRWHTRRIPRPDTGHESLRLEALAGEPPAAPVVPWFTLSREDRAEAERWLAGHGIDGAFLVLAPGARWATKRWPHFPALAATLHHPIVALGGPDDAARGAAIVAAAEGRAASAAGALTLPQSAAVIARARLVITNDSVALHLAASLGRPVLLVAGPTGPAPGFEPPGVADRIVAHPSLPCRPCSPHGHDHCPLGHHRCMLELTPGLVRQAAEAMLERP
jgi:lipopolysaccharide heptosyltransferase II